MLALTPAPDAVPMQRLTPAQRRTRRRCCSARRARACPGHALAASDVPVEIPMRRDVDSLNVAAAAAVAFWELGRDDDPA